MTRLTMAKYSCDTIDNNGGFLEILNTSTAGVERSDK
jgi:hypothetical protein